MNTAPIGHLDFSQILRRKLVFHLNNQVLPMQGNENSDRGEQEALERLIADSSLLTEAQFEAKYLAELANLKTRAEAKDFSLEDGDDYFEAYNNTIVGVLSLLNPLHLYDLSDED